MLGLDDLDPDLGRAAAEADGLHVCWVLPVEDPLVGEPGRAPGVDRRAVPGRWCTGTRSR